MGPIKHVAHRLQISERCPMLWCWSDWQSSNKERSRIHYIKKNNSESTSIIIFWKLHILQYIQMSILTYMKTRKSQLQMFCQRIDNNHTFLIKIVFNHYSIFSCSFWVAEKLTVYNCTNLGKLVINEWLIQWNI